MYSTIKFIVHTSCSHTRQKFILRTNIARNPPFVIHVQALNDSDLSAFSDFCYPLDDQLHAWKGSQPLHPRVRKLTVSPSSCDSWTSHCGASGVKCYARWNDSPSQTPDTKQAGKDSLGTSSWCCSCGIGYTCCGCCSADFHGWHESSQWKSQACHISKLSVVLDDLEIVSQKYASFQRPSSANNGWWMNW